MDSKLIRMVSYEEERGREKWGNVDRTPIDLMIAIQEEIGEVAHAINHEEGSGRVTQEIAEAMGILSRLFDMVIQS